MDTQKLVTMAVIGIVAGWLATFVVGSVKGGIVGLLIAGLVGGIVGGYVIDALKLRLSGNPIVDSIAQSAIGAAIVIVVARLFL